MRGDTEIGRVDSFLTSDTWAGVKKKIRRSRELWGEVS